MMLKKITSRVVISILITESFLFSTSLAGIDEIKEVLIKDKLIEESDRRKLEQLKSEVQQENKKKVESVPITEDEFWRIVTHLWLVKRENRLRWDFEKVDYGVNTVFRSLLSSLDISGKPYKILYLNSQVVPHLGISTGDEYILLLSKPFIEKLDLSKQEIAMILLEEYIRCSMNTLSNKINERFNTLSYQETSKPEKLFDSYLRVLDEEIFDKGFSFQEQFKLTKEVITYLNNKKSLNMYVQLNDKIKSLTSNDQKYKFYSKIYPSPDLKETWLTKLMPGQN